MNQDTKTGPISIDDVRSVIGETSPFETNASKVRELLKRGSFATIQKHLETLRTQRNAASQPTENPLAPKIPADLSESIRITAEAMWLTAFNTAQAKTLSRLDALSAERDALFANSKAQAEDLAALSAQLDQLDTQAQGHAQELSNAKDAAKSDALAAQERITEHAQSLAAALGMAAKIRGDAAHAAELAQRDAQIERQTYQQTIERLTQLLSESKALHMASASASAQATPIPPTGGQ